MCKHVRISPYNCFIQSLNWFGLRPFLELLEVPVVKEQILGCLTTDMPEMNKMGCVGAVTMFDVEHRVDICDLVVPKEPARYLSSRERSWMLACTRGIAEASTFIVGAYLDPLSWMPPPSDDLELLAPCNTMENHMWFEKNASFKAYVKDYCRHTVLLWQKVSCWTCHTQTAGAVIRPESPCLQLLTGTARILKVSTPEMKDWISFLDQYFLSIDMDKDALNLDKTIDIFG